MEGGNVPTSQSVGLPTATSQRVITATTLTTTNAPMQQQPPVQQQMPMHQVLLRQASVPEFISKNVQLWISLVEDFFTQAGINDDRVRVTLITTKLESETMQLCSDILMNTTMPNHYGSLKERIVQMHDQSRQKKLNDLMTGGGITAQKPSTRFQQMRQLVDPSYTDAMVHDIWYSKQNEA